MINKRVRKWLLGGLVICSLLGMSGCARQDENSEAQEEVEETVRSETEIEQEKAEQEAEVEIEQEDEDALSGMKLSILGDSISTYEGYIQEGYNVYYPYSGEVTDVEQTWWKMLLNDTGMEMCANASSSGSTCVGDSTSIDNPLYGCSDYRITDLVGSGGAYPDIIIVYIGTNDLLMSSPIGENDGTKSVEEGNIENFSDAYCLILDKLAANYPAAQIFCCTLTPIGDWGTEQPFVTFENGLALASEDYSESIKTIAEAKGYPVIDLKNCGITIDNMQQFVTDGVHVNPDGMALIKDAVTKVLEEYY